ncbi:MAG: TonB-dependent receptor [Candidatus Handelsmanbacteria bacterium]|nr:TonB-dependent receptor [Candidatus Handelsmanbacteria bacterium]
MKYSIVALALLFLPAAALAAALSGFVRDQASGESLPFVNVYLKGENRGTTSNESGYYALAKLPAGSHTLVASLVGYRSFEKQFQVGDEDQVVNINLQEESIQLETTTVEAKREEVESFDISPGLTTLQIKELKTAPAAIEADPIRTIQTLPGVSALSDFSVGLYVRGGTPDQNLVLLDGTDVYNASHLFGLFSTFPADAAKSTELLRGGYPAKYGDRLSAVLNVITDEGNKEEFEAQGGLSLLSSRLTLQGPAGKGSWLLSGRRTHLDPVIGLAKEALDAKKFAYNFYDLQGKTHQVFSHADQLTLAGYTGQDALEYRFDEFDIDLEWGNRTISSKWTHVFGSGLFGNFLFTGSRFKAATHFSSEDVEILESNRLTDLSLKGDLNYFPASDHAVEAGFLLKHLSLEYNFGEADQNWITVDTEGYHHAFYAQDHWTLTPRLTLQPGLRFSYATNGKYSGVAPRLALRYQLGVDTYLKSAAGRYHQYLFRLAREFQGISLLSNIWTMADSTAEPSEALHYIVGAETRWLGLDVDAEGYFKDYTGLYELNYDNQTSTKMADVLRRGDGRAYGFDLLLKRREGKHTGWLSFSTGLSERTIKGLNLDAQGREQPYKSKFDRRFSMDLIHSWRFRKKWTLNTALAYASGQPYTQVLGRGELVMPWSQRFEVQNKGELNGVRLPSYQRLDMGVERQFNFRSWDMKFFFQVVNLTNRKNIFNYFWSEGKPEERKPAKRREIPMLPLLPSLGIDFNF